MKQLKHYILMLFVLCCLITVAAIHPSPRITTNSVNQPDATPGYPGERLYGVNNFAKVTVRELPSGYTRFFFAGNTNARRVQLSGSFNSWTTQKGLMTKTDSGWVADIKLEAGAYAYKYIVNGRWTRDLTNNLKEDDGFNEYNSIYYRYNYTFRLAGNSNARRVSVAGNFNKWNANEMVMSYNGKGWEKQLYLHEGTHLYRFMIDGRWITDPANRIIANGDKAPSSVLTLGEAITFKLNGYNNVKNVYLAGSFNNWQPNAIRFQKTANGWVLPYVLPAGNYLYKFILDGQWIPDPVNPHTIVTDDKNSFIAVKPNYTFVLKGHDNAKSVLLSGDFNNWNEQGYTMQHVGNEWRISMRLKAGKYRYKFIVDGNWIRDPGNKQWEQNEFNTGNSVLWLNN
jgi:1,4-alpha-glucan branching enzyme